LREAELAGLGLHRIPVPIPFVAAGGPVNVYVLEAKEGLILFDAGLGSDEAQAALLAGLERLGHRTDQISRIVVSHGHVDHFGAARFLQEQAGRDFPVLAHPADIPKIAEAGLRFRDQQPHYAVHLRRLGVPDEVLVATARAGETSFRLSRRVPVVGALAEGDVVAGRQLRFEVLHMPGHTSGLVCLWEPRLRLLLAADHLLEKVSPNPVMELDGEGGQVFWPLRTYLDSIARTRALDVALVLPGHGPPFAGHRAVIDGLLDYLERRQVRLLEHLTDGPQTGWELCQALFPRAGAGEAFLTMSETVAHLEVLEARGAVERTEVDGVWRFSTRSPRAH
jgi:glyoxylase-like metal-dependent hydrolase (beta-lactamase superfamily II)